MRLKRFTFNKLALIRNKKESWKAIKLISLLFNKLKKVYYPLINEKKNKKKKNFNQWKEETPQDSVRCALRTSPSTAAQYAAWSSKQTQ